MLDLKQYEVWFVTGSQHLYGPKTLETVAEHSREIAAFWEPPNICRPGRFQASADNTRCDPSTMFGSEVHEKLCGSDHLDAYLLTSQNVDRWFEPAEETIPAFAHTIRPGIPWSTIDMDFMNLNQSAHGDREFGFIGSRMRLNRKVVVGHWQDVDVQEEYRRMDSRCLCMGGCARCKIARFGDNMRDVAVTEGDKVEAQIQLGYDVYGYGVGDLVKLVKEATEAEVDKLVQNIWMSMRLPQL